LKQFFQGSKVKLLYPELVKAGGLDCSCWTSGKYAEEALWIVKANLPDDIMPARKGTAF